MKELKRLKLNKEYREMMRYGKWAEKQRNRRQFQIEHDASWTLGVSMLIVTVMIILGVIYA